MQTPTSQSLNSEEASRIFSPESFDLNASLRGDDSLEEFFSETSENCSGFRYYAKVSVKDTGEDLIICDVEISDLETFNEEGENISNFFSPEDLETELIMKNFNQ